MPSRYARLTASFALAASLMSACGEPECPHGFYKQGKLCKREDSGQSAIVGEGGADEEEDASAEDAAGRAFDTGTANSEGGTGLNEASVDASGAIVADAADSQAATDSQVAADAEAGPPVPSAECDSAHPCSAGYSCTQEKCVSKCTQTQCDQNATCSLVEGKPTCSCGNGFIQMTSGTGMVTCTKDVSCVELACDANASCVLNADQTRTCVCKPGFKGTGKACSPVDCGPPSLANGTATARNGATTYDATVDYECNSGYIRTGPSSAKCGVDAKWSATVSCTPIDCGTPSLQNGTATLTGAATTFGSGARFTCNTGYTPTGTTMATCGASGQWSPRPSCSVVTCSPQTLVAPARATISYSNENNYQSVATYSCSNALLFGNASRTCQANGTWSGSSPKCLFCGDGEVANEVCDPTAPEWSTWSCSPQCTRRTAYTPCSGNNGSQGIGCDPGQTCFGGACATTSCNGDSTCPSVQAGTRLCIGSGLCVVGCNSSNDCAPGLLCLTSTTPHICTGCGSSAPCPAGKVCHLYDGEAFGRCD